MEVIAALHGEATIEASVTPLHAEDIVRRQIDRIGYLRSVGMDWSEALLQLRDELVGLEDYEFKYGIPDRVMKHLVSCTDNPRWRQPDWPDVVPGACSHVTPSELDRYMERGWETMTIDGTETEEGEQIFDPSPQDLARMNRILHGLMSRQGLMWRQRIHSKATHDWSETDEET